MGNAYLYYYPERDAGLQTFDFGEGLGTLDDQSEPQGGLTRGLGGQVFPSNLGRFDTVRASRDGIVSMASYAALRTFEAYAETRRPFGLSHDHAKTWGGYCNRIRLRGETTIPLTSANAFSAYSASGTVANGDYVVIESGYPEWTWEMAQVSSLSGSTLTLSAGLKRSYRETPILVRWFRFWPFLATPSSGAMLTPTGPTSWTWALEAQTIAAANPAARLLTQILETGTGSTKSGGRSTLNDLYGGQTKNDGLGKRGGGRPGDGFGK